MGASFVLVTAVAILQLSGIFIVAGNKINLSLALLISLIFFIKNNRDFLFLALWSSLLLKTELVFNDPVLLYLFLVLSAYFLKDFLPWQPVIANLILIAFCSAILGLPRFFGGELILNLGFGLLFFYFLEFFYENKKSIRF